MPGGLVSCASRLWRNLPFGEPRQLLRLALPPALDPSGPEDHWPGLIAFPLLVEWFSAPVPCRVSGPPVWGLSFGPRRLHAGEVLLAWRLVAGQLRAGVPVHQLCPDRRPADPARGRSDLAFASLKRRHLAEEPLRLGERIRISRAWFLLLRSTSATPWPSDRPVRRGFSGGGQGRPVCPGSVVDRFRARSYSDFAEREPNRERARPVV